MAILGFCSWSSSLDLDGDTYGEEYVLDEDDYELLEDNNVFAPRRKGKFKRLKKAQRHTERDLGVSDEEEFDGNGKSGRSAEEKLKRSLFGDDEGLPLEDIAEEEGTCRKEDDGEVGEEDEMADFIVDEEFDATGVLVRQKKLKRKKFREAPGVSSSSLHEAHEIFGDVDELLQLRKQGSDSNECRDRKLEDEFEPSVLSEKYMTEKDDQIRELDVPERIQIYEESTGSPPLDEISIEDESTWIYNQLTSGTIPLYGKEGLGSSISRGDINKFLELHHKYKLEIPFIAMYRKECLSFLKDETQDQNEKPPKIKWHKELWTIQDLDRKWLLLQKRKSALQSYYKQFECTVNHQILESVITSLEASESEREVDDADAKFNLHFPRFAGVKWLQRKPLNRFEGAQWLLIQKAEEEKLLEVTLQLPEDRLNKLISDFNEYYLSDGMSSGISVGPYHRKENDSSSDGEAAPRVMACCWGPGKPATTFVMLDSSGEVVDILYAGSLTSHSHDVNDQKLKKNDEERVLKFMIDHQPLVAILGCVNMSCTRLKEAIHEIYNKMIVEHPRDVGYDMDDLSIVYGDESFARLYENSRISSDQLHVQSGIVKRAVALGRYLQNPLAMVATLCGPGREILSWKLNAFEHFLTPDEKYAMVEQVMVDVTNQVGLDVNLAASHEWLFAPLQFISGLGPRKAASLQRSLVRSGAIFSRKDFLTEEGLGLKVFVNASGFLRVRRSGLAASSNQFIDLLDDTRIHPTESYGRAQELAKVVYDQEGGNDDDEDAMEMAIEHVRGHPKYLKGLDIESYSKSKKHEDKENTLWDIKRELIHGFQDWRKKYEEPSQDEEFYMISGETEDTLAVGRIVQATVRRVHAEQAQLALESGLTGMLLKEDYHPGDWRDVSDLSDRLHVGDILTCKIKSVQKNWYRVLLVCSASEIRNDCSQNIQNLDTYYHKDWRSLQSEQEKSQKGKQLAKKNFKPRMIVHPRFQNIHADEATELLSGKDAGESIFRPSSRGPSHLTLTLKVYDGVYAHKDIVEGGKEPKDVTSLLRIGKTLTIGEDTFEDLDEVMDRYVDPLVAHLKAMLNYRKFRRGTKAEVDELLWLEKLEYPMRIAYCLGYRMNIQALSS
ncbi:transcription elongation factor SPT6-like [Prunus yedoensis var. nudiflora]|uniref:Transcription elongation factor SPT6-like n=1 Tax=Prunus yedoensis var. nudiflora TaxID=2094558 RepID=A0A314XQK8_PRUYE|nr:transcription elongation factor SPT6-like [Prunus yedoensis var. nudiflora]